MPVSEIDQKALLDKAPVDGRGIGNGTLMQALGWAEAQYKAVRDSLIRARVLAMEAQSAIRPFNENYNGMTTDTTPFAIG
jgi:hypothetical protein